MVGKSNGRGLLEAESFSLYSHYGLIAYCFWASLSIAVSQTIITVLLLYWLTYAATKIFSSKQNSQTSADSNTVLTQSEPAVSPAQKLATPMLYWVIISLISTLIGINPWHALPETIKSSFYLLIPFLIFGSLTATPLNNRVLIDRIRGYLLIIILSQVLAALHTIIESGFPQLLASAIVRPPGPVTESGQIVLVIACLTALIFLAHRRDRSRDTSLRQHFWTLQHIAPALYLVLLFFCILLLAWPTELLPPLSNRVLLFVQLTTVVAMAIIFGPRLYRCTYRLLTKPLLLRGINSVDLGTIIWFAAVIVGSALIINLKRGPWLGVVIQLVVLGMFLSRRLVLLTIFATLFLFAVLSPARGRLLHFADDFSISGGRQKMWSIAVELAQRFPLGLGMDNAAVIRELDPSIPQFHRHMHNNILNVSAESGWLGVLVFLWWMVSIIGMGMVSWIRLRRSPNRHIQDRALVALALCCGLLGWQVAGSVEYNFGDGEVCMIALFFMGLIVSLLWYQDREPNRFSNAIS